MLKREPFWQSLVVEGYDGEPAVRFLGPHAMALVEIPASVLREAVAQLGELEQNQKKTEIVNTLQLGA